MQIGIGIEIDIQIVITGDAPPPPPETFRILLESGNTLTYESGDHMKQDQA